MAKTSEFYFHHSGFGSCLLVNFLAQGEQPLNTFSAVLDSPKRRKLRDIRAGKNAIYIEFPLQDNSSEEDEGPYVCLGFFHDSPNRRKRIDLFVSPGTDPKHIHARLTSNLKEVLFDGEIPMREDENDEPPICLYPKVA